MQRDTDARADVAQSLGITATAKSTTCASTPPPNMPKRHHPLNEMYAVAHLLRNDGVDQIVVEDVHTYTSRLMHQPRAVRKQLARNLDGRDEDTQHRMAGLDGAESDEGKTSFKLNLTVPQAQSIQDLREGHLQRQEGRCMSTWRQTRKGRRKQCTRLHHRAADEQGPPRVEQATCDVQAGTHQLRTQRLSE